MSKGLPPWESFLSFLTFGIYFEKYAHNLELRIPVFGDSPWKVFILRVQLIGPFFGASSLFGLGEEYGNLGLQVNAHFFMWLVAYGRCWTVDRLANRGLPHLARKMSPLWSRGRNHQPSAIVLHISLENFGIYILLQKMVCSPLLHS